MEDAARANICALKSEVVDEFFNVGMGTKTTIKEITDLLLELTGSKLEPKYEPQGQTFVTHRIGSTKNAKDKLGFEAMTPLREGLKRLIEWRKNKIVSTAGKK